MPPVGYYITNAEAANTVFYRRLITRGSEGGLRPAQAVSALGPRRGAVSGVTTTTASAKYIQGLINQRLFLDVTGQHVNFTAGFISADIVGSAVSRAVGATAESLSLFMSAMAQSASRKQGLARIHEAVAREAHHAVITAYEGRFTGQDHYRAGQNRLSGKMSPTLRRSDLILATRDGIFYMNRNVLDRGAAHWYRLNFGAMPAGRQRSPKQFPVKFDGQTLGKLSLAGNRPSAGFMLPKGVWISSGRVVPHDITRSRAEGVRGRVGDQFYTVKWFYNYVGGVQRNKDAAGRLLGSLKDLRAGEKKRTRRDPGRTPFKDAVKTRGIRGAHFFDAGVEVISRELPLQYSSLLLKWQQESSRSGTGPIARVIARPE